MPSRFVRDGEIWKACPRCEVETPHNDEYYYRSGKHADGSTRFYTACKACCQKAAKIERSDRSENARERHKRRLRARQRAWVKLGQRYPAELRDLYEEELAREYLAHGPMPKTV